MPIFRLENNDLGEFITLSTPPVNRAKRDIKIPPNTGDYRKAKKDLSLITGIILESQSKRFSNKKSNCTLRTKPFILILWKKHGFAVTNIAII